jgi:hypothetical protein
VSATPASPSLALWHAYQRQLRPLAAALTVGATLGLLIGGVGGRLAMRLIFLTSDPAVAGMVSDDGFVIGQITPGTLFLLALGGLTGVAGVLIYLAIRPLLLGPAWAKWVSSGLWAAVVVGTLLIHTDGVDFTLLSPRWLSIALFVALPGLYGLLIGPAVDRATRPDGWFHRASPWLALPPLALILLPGPPLFLFGLPVFAVIGLAHLARKSPRLTLAFRHPALLWSARAVWAGVGIAAALDLSRKITVLL